jgi:probable phosphoglycerate mutase
MKRAIATAKPLREAVCLEMQLRDAFKEIRYGKWEDNTLDFVKQHYWDDCIHWLAEPAWNAPTGGETSVEISDRALAVIAEIQRKYATGNVIVVLSQSNDPNYSL